MADIVVKTEDVVKEYRMGSNVLRALDGINIEIERGEYVSLMGPSGSGKSTLFNMIGALDTPTEGQVYIDGQNMSHLSQRQIARAIIHKPRLILADEPTANLDTVIGREIIDLIKQLNEEQGVTIISATHDLKMLDVSDRIVDIRDGLVERIRNRDEIEIEVGEVGGH